MCPMGFRVIEIGSQMWIKTTEKSPRGECFTRDDSKKSIIEFESSLYSRGEGMCRDGGGER